MLGSTYKLRFQISNSSHIKPSQLDDAPIQTAGDASSRIELTTSFDGFNQMQFIELNLQSQRRITHVGRVRPLTLRTLSTVLRSTLFAILHTCGIQRASNNVIANSR